MPATARKSRIRKAATAVEALVAPTPQVFELSNMQIEEVSIVDRPANQREFLLRKKAEEKKAAEAAAAAKSAEAAEADDSEDQIDLAAAQKAADDLKAKDAAEKAAGEAQRAAEDLTKAKWTKAFIDDLPDSAFLYVESGKKDDDGKTVPRANRHFPYKSADGAVDLPHLRDAASRIPQSDLPDDKKKSLADKAAKILDKEDKKSASKAAPAVVDPAAAAAELVAATKADITVSTPSGDVTVTVDEPEAPAPTAPQALIDRVKAATLAGIDAITERLAKMRADVDTNPAPFYSSTGTSDALWGHVWYLKSMLDALYNIGGPEWEIESAGDDVGKSAAVEKGHKAINASRATKLAAIHKCVTYAMKDLSALVKEVNNDQDENEVDEDEGEPVDTNKAAPVVAPPAPVVVVAPAASPEIAKQLGELSDMVRSLKTTVANQAADIAKARNTVVASNAQTPEQILATSVPEHDTIIWPADIAAKPARRRF